MYEMISCYNLTKCGLHNSNGMAEGYVLGIIIILLIVLIIEIINIIFENKNK